MNFHQLTYNDHTLFHMLRHFEYVNELARECLKDRGYSMGVIDENLAIPGSKFHETFANDIKSLVEQLKLGKAIQILERKKYREIIIDFNQTEFTNGIGTLGVCNQNELNACADKDKIVNELIKEIAALKKENDQLHKKIIQLQHQVCDFPLLQELL